MTDDEALVAAIVGADCETAEERRARWSDDTPRLAYADYLEETAGEVECEACKGKPTSGFVGSSGKQYVSWCPTCSGTGRVSDGRRERAEFIRLQIKIKLHEGDKEPPHVKIDPKPGKCKKCKGWFAGLGKCGCAYGDRRSEAWTRLINEHSAWVAERKYRADREKELGRYCQDHRGQFYNLPEEVVVKGGWMWERGFCNNLRMGYDDWYEHGDLVLSRQPVEEVTLVLSETQYSTYLTEHANVQQATHFKWKGPEFKFITGYMRERWRRWAGVSPPLPVVHSDFSFDQRIIEMARLDTMMPVIRDPRTIIYTTNV